MSDPMTAVEAQAAVDDLCDWWANWTIWGQVTRGVAKERNR